LYVKALMLHPEDGFMKAETRCCYVRLINYILYSKLVLDYEILCFC